jgi:hypothetical protein
MGPRCTRRRRWSSVASCTLALTLLAAPSASAADASADPWLAAVARELRGDPVYVSDSVSRAVSARDVTQLRAAVAAMPVPTRVAILSGPPNNFDVEGASLFDLPELLAGAIDRPGLYVVVDATDDGFGSVHMTAVGARTRVAPADVERAVGRDVPGTQRIVTRVRYALRVAATGARPLRGVADRALARDLATEDKNPNATEDAVAIGFMGVGSVAGFVWPTLRWWRRRPRRARPARLEAVVREPDADIAARARDAVAQLSAAIDAAQQPPDEAFELYSAASKAESEARTPVDHVGALVLAQKGAATVAGDVPRRRCFFDPDHRGKVTLTRWRLGHKEAEVPACPRCVRRLRAGRAPDSLGDDGKPYFERDTVWGRTGFGTVDDDLAATVLSGR